MCGLSGFFGGSEDDLRRMVAQLSHRGPDAEGMWYQPDQGLGLGHRRLVILDPEWGGQPMWTQDRQLAIIFNGLIYNHADLRQELISMGHSFRSDHSDTETLLLAYRAWGPSMVRKLNGMWAFVIFDQVNQRFFCCRDRFGQKPFYYYHHQGLFAFASELRALTAHRQIERTIDPQALEKFFGYGYIPAPQSIYRHIHKLPAGHFLTFDLNSRQIDLQPFWVPDQVETYPDTIDERQLAEEARERLERAVQTRLLADVPVGTFLSGGLDSSAVTYFAAKARGERRIKAFSIGFEDDSFDESPYAIAAAQTIGCDHILEKLTWDDLEHRMDDIVGRLDEPMADSSLLPTFMLAGLAKKSVTVALSGDGADELFAGYDPFRAIAPAYRYHRLIPSPIHRMIKAMVNRFPVSHRNISLDFKLKKTLAGLDFSPDQWIQSWMAPLQLGQLQRLFDRDLSFEEIYPPFSQHSQKPEAIAKTFTYFFLYQYLQNGVLTKVDRASMMHGLEVRSPFLDKDWVDFAFRVPIRFKLKGTTTKYLLKRALEPLLPKTILHRKKKGFGVPVGQWFRQGKLTISTQRTSSFLDDGIAKTWLREHQQGKADHRLFLWCHWVLERFLEREASRS